MKKILSYILISSIIFVNLLTPFSVGISGKKIEIKKNEARAASNCKIGTVTFSPITTNKDKRPPIIDYTITTSGCIGVPNIIITTEVDIMHTVGANSFEKAVQQKGPNGGPFTSDTVTGSLITGEKDCKGGTCELRYIFYVYENGVKIDENHDYDNSSSTLGFACDTSTCNNNSWDSITDTGAWFFIKTSADGKSTQNFNAVDEASCIKERGVYLGLIPDANLSPCQLKTQAQVATVDVYYFEILNNGALIDQSADYGGSTAKADCETAKKAFDDSITQQGQTNVNTSACKTKTVKQITSGSNTGEGTNTSSQTMPACSILGIGSGTFTGCIAQSFYYVLFVPTSYLFALSGLFFDSTFAYSVNDQSYRSAFVVQGWGLLRDFCNMLFIFIMLYVAIGTILSLHSMKTKETIVNVVIIGLFINFSLFATQVIIDASNITARVFYNSDAIKITQKGTVGATNVVSTVGAGGVIPLSAALVNKVNPQNLILKSTEINNISNNSSAGINNAQGATTPGGIGPGQFILIVIMASGVNIVGFTVFLTIGFLFIARVIGLWLAMILSPLAFFTYILPEMAGTKMIGWKNWWPETLKMAFLAPVFIFFMYIILKFLETDLISDASSKTGLAFFVATLIPFAFIMILMLKAKKIATDMSGEFGEMVTKAGSAVGGLALGAATGGAAFAMRGTLGAMGDKVANSDWAKTHGRLGNMVADAGKWTSSRSFDVRKTALGTMAGKEMGVDMGKAKEGGYAKHKTEITEKRRARAESHKLGNNSKEVQQLHTSEEDLANLKNTAKNDTDRIDGTLAAKRLVASDASQKLTSANAKLARAEKDAENLDKDPNATQIQKDAAKAEIANAQTEAKAAQNYFDTNAKTIADLTQERIELNSGTGRHWDKTSDGKVHEGTYNNLKSDAANKEATFKSKSASLDTDIKTATDNAEKGIMDDFDQAEAELNELKQTLADETAIANPESPQDMALLQQTKDKVEAANNNWNILQNSKDSMIKTAKEKAEKQVQDEFQTVAKENTVAQESFGKIEAARVKNGFSDPNPDKQRSLDGLNLKIIPHEHHHVEEVNAERVNEYAKTIRGRFFNKEANDVAAHEAIMRSEIKKH